LEERPVPAAGRERPRSREHASVDYDRPDTDETMCRARSRTHAEDLRRIDFGQDTRRKAALVRGPLRLRPVRLTGSPNSRLRHRAGRYCSHDGYRAAVVLRSVPRGAEAPSSATPQPGWARGPSTRHEP